MTQPTGTAPPLRCSRCDAELEYRGTKKIHEGTQWGFHGDIAELFENCEKLEFYLCPRCGKVELYVDRVGEDYRPG